MKSNRGKIMVSTNIFTKDGFTSMVYHKTVVSAYKVINDPEDSSATRRTNQVELDTGGYFSPTTKKRMNQFADMFDLPYRVYQNKGQWYAAVFKDKVDFSEKYDTLPFNGNTLSFTVTK